MKIKATRPPISSKMTASHAIYIMNAGYNQRMIARIIANIIIPPPSDSPFSITSPPFKKNYKIRRSNL